MIPFVMPRANAIRITPDRDYCINDLIKFKKDDPLGKYKESQIGKIVSGDRLNSYVDVEINGKKVSCRWEHIV